MSFWDDEADSPHVSEDERAKFIADALADPLRSKIFLAITDAAFLVGPAAGSEPAALSVRQIAERTEESRRRVRYHLGVLCEQGLAEVVEEKKRRGVVEHYFRASATPLLTKSQMEDLPAHQQRKIILDVLKTIFAEATTSLERGTFIRRPEWAAVRLHADVDEQGWVELARTYEETTRKALEVIANSAARLEGSSKPTVRLSVAFLLFETADDENPEIT